MSFLLDTDVLSELRKGARADPGVRHWFEQVRSEELWLSCLTLGEIRNGIERLRKRDPSAAEGLDRWQQRVTEAYGDRILDIDRQIAERWGYLEAEGPLPVVDGLIAATAKRHGMVLVTGNPRDMSRMDVEILVPFTHRAG